MTEPNQGLTPYRSMTAIEPKPKKLHGIIPNEITYPDNHKCSKPILSRIIRGLLFWLPSLKWGSIYRCRKCGKVWEVDWEYPYSWQQGWYWQELRWRETTIEEWVKMGGDK